MVTYRASRQQLCKGWECQGAPQGQSRAGALAHQDEVVHDVLTELQASGTRYFQEQVAGCFLNLKNWISEENSYWYWAASCSTYSEESISRATEGWRCSLPALDA